MARWCVTVQVNKENIRQSGYSDKHDAMKDYENMIYHLTSGTINAQLRNLESHIKPYKELFHIQEDKEVKSIVVKLRKKTRAKKKKYEYLKYKFKNGRFVGMDSYIGDDLYINGYCKESLKGV